MNDLVAGDDGRTRCGWCVGTPEYIAYHDTEWGRDVHDDVRLFEKLCLEGFQSGLSWLTVLRKRVAFREAFSDFIPAKVAAYGDRDVEQLLDNADIIRHRGKIQATIANARAVVAMHEARESLDTLVWSFAPPAPGHAPARMAQVPAVTAESTALSKELKSRGFRFVGPTTAYAFMQAMGLVNDHLEGCDFRDSPT